MDNFWLILLVVLIVIIIIAIIVWSNNNNSNKYYAYTFVNDYTEKAKLTITDAKCGKVLVDTYVNANDAYTFNLYTNTTLNILFENPSGDAYTISLQDYYASNDVVFLINDGFKVSLNSLQTSSTVTGKITSITYENKTGTDVTINTTVTYAGSTNIFKLPTIASSSSTQVLASVYIALINGNFVDIDIPYCISEGNQTSCTPGATPVFKILPDSKTLVFTITGTPGNYVLTLTQS